MAGEVLRRTRRSSGLTLRDVTARSGGRFKPSVLGDYERGERRISLERFCELAHLYEVPPDRLLGEILARCDPRGRTEIVIDLTRIKLVEGEEGQALAEFAHRVKSQRGDYLSDVLTLRSGDLEALSLACHRSTSSLLEKFAPALQGVKRRGEGAGPARRTYPGPGRLRAGGRWDGDDAVASAGDAAPVR